ncbi:MAG: hypothetical protein ACOX9C_07440 [Kiritimatiellia bacterium]
MRCNPVGESKILPPMRRAPDRSPEGGSGGGICFDAAPATHEAHAPATGEGCALVTAAAPIAGRVRIAASATLSARETREGRVRNVARRSSIAGRSPVAAAAPIAGRVRIAAAATLSARETREGRVRNVARRSSIAGRSPVAAAAPITGAAPQEGKPGEVAEGRCSRHGHPVHGDAVAFPFSAACGIHETAASESRWIARNGN